MKYEYEREVNIRQLAISYFMHRDIDILFDFHLVFMYIPLLHTKESRVDTICTMLPNFWCKYIMLSSVTS
jgi:hypothetical protein